MGQSTSSENSSPEHMVPDSVGVIQDEVFRHARILSEIATLTYEDFQLCLAQLNALSKKVSDHDGKQLLFAVKKGTDSTVLWKGTVKIACVKLNPETKVIDTYRLVNLNQFLRIFKTLKSQLSVAIQSCESEMVSSSNNSSGQTVTNESTSCSDDSSYHESGSDNSSSSDGDTTKSLSLFGLPKNLQIHGKRLTASMLLREVDDLTNNLANGVPDKLVECCICLERKPDVMLPCAHAYCLPCIEQWNTCHKTCPICRDTLDSTDDTWVISDIPGSQEINQEICTALMDLTKTLD